LQRVEVQDQTVRFYHLDGAATFVGTVAIVQLHRAQVGQQEDVGGDVAHAVGICHGWVLDGGAL